MDSSGVIKKGMVVIYIPLVAFENLAELNLLYSKLTKIIGKSGIHIRKLNSESKKKVYNALIKILKKHVIMVLKMTMPLKANNGVKAKKRTWIKKKIIKRIYQLIKMGKKPTIIFVPSDLDTKRFILANELRKEFESLGISIFRTNNHKAVEVADAFAFVVRRYLEEGESLSYMF